jgi:antitoxin YefM
MAYINAMRATSITDFRKNIATDFDQVVDVPLLITRSGGKPAGVLISLEDYSSWQETNYLLSSPANAKRLQQSIDAFEAGKGIAKPWPE